jgi:hypothetical protein
MQCFLMDNTVLYSTTHNDTYCTVNSNGTIHIYGTLATCEVASLVSSAIRQQIITASEEENLRIQQKN